MARKRNEQVSIRKIREIRGEFRLPPAAKRKSNNGLRLFWGRTSSSRTGGRREADFTCGVLAVGTIGNERFSMANPRCRNRDSITRRCGFVLIEIDNCWFIVFKKEIMKNIKLILCAFLLILAAGCKPSDDTTPPATTNAPSTNAPAPSH
jgi:hypothetical protein